MTVFALEIRPESQKRWKLHGGYYTREYAVRAAQQLGLHKGRYKVHEYVVL